MFAGYDVITNPLTIRLINVYVTHYISMGGGALIFSSVQQPDRWCVWCNQWGSQTQSKRVKRRRNTRTSTRTDKTWLLWSSISTRRLILFGDSVCSMLMLHVSSEGWYELSQCCQMCAAGCSWSSCSVRVTVVHCRASSTSAGQVHGHYISFYTLEI